MKQKLVVVCMTIGLMLGFGILFNPSGAYAQNIPAGCPGSDQAGPLAPGTQCPAQPPASSNDNCEASNNTYCCGKVKTSIITGPEFCGGTDTDNTTAERSTIWKLLIQVLNIMTAGIGIAAVGGIVFGAILYTTAEDKPDQTKRAIGIITNVVIGLVAYGLMYVLLNWLIPGGVFS